MRLGPGSPKGLIRLAVWAPHTPFRGILRTLLDIFFRYTRIPALRAKLGPRGSTFEKVGGWGVEGVTLDSKP